MRSASAPVRTNRRLLTLLAAASGATLLLAGCTAAAPEAASTPDGRRHPRLRDRRRRARLPRPARRRQLPAGARRRPVPRVARLARRRRRHHPVARHDVDGIRRRAHLGLHAPRRRHLHRRHPVRRRGREGRTSSTCKDPGHAVVDRLPRPRQGRRRSRSSTTPPPASTSARPTARCSSRSPSRGSRSSRPPASPAAWTRTASPPSAPARSWSTEWVQQDHLTLARNDDYTSAPADAAHDGARLPRGHRVALHPRLRLALRRPAVRRGRRDRQRPARHDRPGHEERLAGRDRRTPPRRLEPHRAELLAGAVRRRARARGLHPRRRRERRHRLAVLRHRRSAPTPSLSSVEPLGYSDETLFDDATSTRRTALLDEAGWTDARLRRLPHEGRQAPDRCASRCRPTSRSRPSSRCSSRSRRRRRRPASTSSSRPLDLSSWYGALVSDSYELVSAPYTKVGPDVLRMLYDSAGITPAPSGYFANLAQLNDPKLDELLRTRREHERHRRAGVALRAGAEDHPRRATTSCRSTTSRTTSC